MAMYLCVQHCKSSLIAASIVTALHFESAFAHLNILFLCAMGRMFLKMHVRSVSSIVSFCFDRLRLAADVRVPNIPPKTWFELSGQGARIIRVMSERVNRSSVLFEFGRFGRRLGGYRRFHRVCRSMSGCQKFFKIRCGKGSQWGEIDLKRCDFVCSRGFAGQYEGAKTSAQNRNSPLF